MEQVIAGWVTIYVKCKWCNHGANITLTAQPGATLRFKCPDRGCHMEQELVLS